MNLLITGAWKPTAEQLKTIRSLGWNTLEMPDERGELPCAYDSVDAVICNGLFLYHPMERFTALRYVQLTSAGFDRVRVDDAATRGIVLHNARGVYSTPMAEFAVAAVLDFYQQRSFFKERQRQHKWEKHRGLLELFGKTVCIIGCGSVGTECAKRFRAFGCEVVGVNRSGETRDAFDCVVPMGQLQTAVSNADVVIVAVALTEETRHLIGAPILSVMKDGCVLVNVSRGAVVDTETLLTALQEKRIYAALDVFEEEPLGADSPLWDMENVMITPHNSFVGDGNQARLWRVILENLEQYR